MRIGKILTGPVIFALLALLVAGGGFFVFDRTTDLDAYFAARESAHILAPLDKKIILAESAGIGAAYGLREQKTKILQSVAEPDRFPDGIHPYILPEYRVFVTRLKRINHHSISGQLERWGARLNKWPDLFDNHWFLYGALCALVLTFSVLLFLWRLLRNAKKSEKRTEKKFA